MRAIGKMDQYIELFSSAESNINGEMTTAWTSEGSVWSEVTGAHGSEALEAARQNARESIRVRIHTRDDVDTGWKLTWKTRDYYIQYVDRTDQRKGDLWITALAVNVV